jgi:hypothetical protein
MNRVFDMFFFYVYTSRCIEKKKKKVSITQHTNEKYNYQLHNYIITLLRVKVKKKIK